MIITYCKFSGLPIAAVDSFAVFNIKAATTHPIFQVKVPKLLDMAASVKVMQLAPTEQTLLGLALVHSTGLVKWQDTMQFRDYPESSTPALFLAAARAAALAYHKLADAPKNIAAFVRELPLFRVCRDSTITEVTNWCRILNAKASAYFETGREARLPDARYGFLATFLDDTSKLSRNGDQLTNKGYALPQVYTSDIGLWAYDALDDLMSNEQEPAHRRMMHEYFKILTMAGSNSARGAAVSNLRDMLHEILPTTTPKTERQKQLTLVYLDKVLSGLTEAQAAMLGERVETEVRTVNGKSWTYTVIAQDTGVGTGAGAATIAEAKAAGVKAGPATSAAGAGMGLDTAGASAKVQPTAAQATPRPSAANVAALRAKMIRRGMLQ